MAEIIAHHSRRPLEAVLADIERDNFMAPEEAVRYGLIDAIIPPRRGLAAPGPARLAPGYSAG